MDEKHFFMLIEEHEDPMLAVSSYMCKDSNYRYRTAMKGFPDVLRKKIRDARVAKNIGQVELSKLLNTTQSTYSSWERGAHIPKIENIIQLAEILNVDPSEFIELNPMGERDRRDAQGDVCLLQVHHHKVL